MLNCISNYIEVFNNLTDGLYIVDTDRRILYWNEAAEKLTGYKSSEVLGMNCDNNILMHINNEGAHLCKKGCRILDSMNNNRQHDAEVYLHHREGHRVGIVMHTAPLKDSEGKIIGAVNIFHDTASKAELQQNIEELKKKALLDPLTDQANRRLIEMQLYSRLEQMHRYGLSFGVLFIDIDHFKDINDKFGHEIGDKVLRMVSKTLADNLRTFDALGRWGGDEFVVIFVNIDGEQLFSGANRLRMLVEQSTLSLDSQSLGVTISIGATLSRPNDTLDVLINRADRLMYQSKSSGRNCVSVKIGSAINNNCAQKARKKFPNAR